MNGVQVVPVQLVQRNGYDLHRPTVGPAMGVNMNTATSEGRSNVQKVATGVAMLGGGVFAMMSIPQAKQVSRYALGGLGAGLLVAGSVSIWDALA